jgi:AbrB family looped-hinge helix DNA binding protein
MAIRYKAPAFLEAADRESDRSKATNHHRYGEVKTRLTIDVTGQIARYYHILSGITGRVSMATTVTSKGQVTIPKPVRDYLGIDPGSEVNFRRADDGSIVIERADGTRPPSRFAKLVGSAGPGPTTDELMELLRGEPE